MIKRTLRLLLFRNDIACVGIIIMFIYFNLFFFHLLSVRYSNADNVCMEVSNVIIFVPPLDNVSSSYAKLRERK